jgi:hypothetical protein
MDNFGWGYSENKIVSDAVRHNVPLDVVMHELSVMGSQRSEEAVKQRASWLAKKAAVKHSGWWPAFGDKPAPQPPAAPVETVEAVAKASKPKRHRNGEFEGMWKPKAAAKPKQPRKLPAPKMEVVSKPRKRAAKAPVLAPNAPAVVIIDRRSDKATVRQTEAESVEAVAGAPFAKRELEILRAYYRWGAACVLEHLLAEQYFRPLAEIEWEAKRIGLQRAN